MKKFIKENWVLFASLIYILIPIDFLPDFVLGFGLIDDLSVVLVSLVIQLYKYSSSKKWSNEF